MITLQPHPGGTPATQESLKYVQDYRVITMFTPAPCKVINTSNNTKWLCGGARSDSNTVFDTSTECCTIGE